MTMIWAQPANRKKPERRAQEINEYLKDEAKRLQHLGKVRAMYFCWNDKKRRLGPCICCGILVGVYD